MKQARIIVGANYGDEGKGTVVAHYTKNGENVLNVLTNGGAQRGHSILTEEGINITSQHFGSGTYYGADSYYSRFFILNPMQFVKEYDSLIVKPKYIYRDPSCRWTTVFDQLANLIEEEQRGRHASCCMGVWNTVKRYKDRLGNISFDGFIHSDHDYQIKILKSIRDYYDRNLTIPDNWKSIWYSDILMEHFINDCKFMYNVTTILDFQQCLPLYDDVIFENGQGLLLTDTGKDEFDRTPSNTGPHDALVMIPLDFKDENITIHYVTRPYLTRHGDGELIFGSERERTWLSKDIQEDRTNHYNDFQGQFRYGFLDCHKLKERLIQESRGLKYEIELTHCDEVDRVAHFNTVFLGQQVNTYDSAIIK